jgi:hypothetical protein
MLLAMFVLSSSVILVNSSNATELLILGGRGSFTSVDINRGETK